MIGKSLAHYVIREKLGQGGMGEVYRAEDQHLGRQVAIKVLPASVAADGEALARFEHEARAVAALSHPNILAIYDFGSHAETAYAVTELLQGATLRSHMQTGALSQEQALDYARQILSGLAATHERGIVHRDLKPENLFVTRDSLLKILDFGLAKIIEPDSPPDSGETTVTSHTMPGAVLGTASYMSPEHVKGQAAEQRSDLFAFGVILYEMLSGTNPFRRDSPLETMTAILRDEPQPLHRLDPQVARHVSDVVQHCLQKEPGERPRSAREITALLASKAAAGTPRHAPGPEPIDSLAVLPFMNESGDSEVDYLSDGLTDTLIDNLGQLPRLRVMARSSVFRYRDQDVDPCNIGEVLGVRGVLTGRLLQRHDQLVVRAELVDVQDGRHLWGGRFERPAADLLIIEDEIAREISENLRLELNRDERARIAKRHTHNADAHRCYLKGRSIWNRWKTPEGMRTAIGFFERALSHDPLYALAFAGLADAYSMLGNVKAVPPADAYPTAKTAAQQGLAIDEGLAELHTSLGFIHRFWDWDWTAAEAAFKRALQLNPGYGTTHRFYAQLLSGLGHHDRAIVVAKQSAALDPMSPMIIGAAGDVFFYARRYEESMAYYRKALEIEPDFLPGHTDLARALEHAGKYQEAIVEFQTAAALAPKGPPEPSSGLAHVYARMGDQQKALEIVEQLKAMRARRYVSPYGIASIYACMGNNQTALEWLDTAYAEHDQTLVWVKAHPRMDGLRNEPRYQNLLRQMKL